MAIKKSTNDSSARLAVLIDTLCSVFYKKIQASGHREMLGQAASFRDELRQLDGILTKAILASDEQPGDYDLVEHAGRVKVCLESLLTVEAEAQKELSDCDLAALIGKAAFVGAELRCMRATCDEISTV